MIRGVSCLLAAFMLAAIAGCSGDNAMSNVPDEGNAPAPLYASDAVPRISYIDGTWDSQIPAPDGAAVQAIDAKFGIDFKPQFYYMQEYPDKLTVTMASGELPDMIGFEFPDSRFVKWARQGAFLRLNDLIARYPTLSQIPQSAWSSVSVDGSIYAIPRWFTKKYGKRPVIHKDWLDNLGLKMPTNYKELKDVLIAFTNDDPDRNGKNDTLGLGMSSVGTGILYGAAMSVGYDSSAWYYRNSAGQLIPGTITSSNKEHVQFLAELYKAGAIAKDWPVSKMSDVRDAFFTGQIGMYFEQPYDFNEKRFAGLRQLQPSAVLAIIPPFVQDDGQSGYISSGNGIYQLITLNAKLVHDPKKADTILGMLDYMSTWIPWEKRVPGNPDFDWQYGGVGVGYEMKEGKPVEKIDAQSLRPKNYLISRYWAPSEEVLQPQNAVTDPLAKQFVTDAVETLEHVKMYKNPVDYIDSPLRNEKESELEKAFTDHVTRMIIGEEPMANWDAAAEEYLQNGGQAIIDEVNKLLKKKGIEPGWE
ncbi:carbohydrate ABC transporter substrate-binding protein (CUT1 family) [Paenibacillus taihuensis]|uniref:Carbohydrate ABC transporter substrate-binding protein (CUT1 family) n=1 Tax=Paenibacillus taihuensis TaxID=1156355 RepID=A0A3D9S3R3_9BACL|nr:extracellular solute-binding protein [Paenibacillus taihuensis]REE87364.1 carbohydrate ABC transporter substrate-binding protein (CUT1 family) [Paenibacillus taihuensis]